MVPKKTGKSRFALSRQIKSSGNIRMVKKSIIISVKKYLTELLKIGIPVQYAILFGSQVRNKRADQWSDIDLLIVSSRYDEEYNREDINLLWRAAARTDSRIEPVPVGLKRWETDDESTIIELARREGIQITV
jgi:predicted nucleotidyltransferase